LIGGMHCLPHLVLGKAKGLSPNNCCILGPFSEAVYRAW
jgi:hypothetical protein